MLSIGADSQVHTVVAEMMKESADEFGIEKNVISEVLIKCVPVLAT
jgi:hypothetical protein